MSWSATRAGLVAVVTAVTVATLAVGCSGDDDAVPTTTSVATTTEPPATTTTVEATTTEPTTVPTTEPVPTTVPESTPSSTPDPTTTSPPDGVPPRVTFPDDPDKQAVVDAVYAYLDSLSLASAAPTDPLRRDEVGKWIVDPMAPKVLSFLDALVDGNERVIPNESMPWYVKVLESTVELGAEAASLDACIFDSDVRVAVGAEPDGSDRVLDEGIVSSYQTFLLVRDGPEWRIREISEFGRFEGENQCV